MQFQKLAINITLATLAVVVQQHAASANPASTSYASTRYDVILQQLGLKPISTPMAQPQTIQPQVTQPKLQERMSQTTSLPSISRASNQYDAILQQLRLKPTQPQAIQSQAIESQAIQPQVIQTQSQKSISTDKAGQTFFSHPPTLIRAASSQLGVSIPSTYEFTLTVPQDAGQPLKAVTIAQAENVETIKFNVSNSKAYTGRRLTASSEVRLSSVGGDQPANSGQETIVFDQPVLPGSTVTIALAAQRNPTSGGTYLFGVTAYPDGENGLGQFLGYGRINFYSNSR